VKTARVTGDYHLRHQPAPQMSLFGFVSFGIATMRVTN
jgi:hypothetical protein